MAYVARVARAVGTAVAYAVIAYVGVGAVVTAAGIAVMVYDYATE